MPSNITLTSCPAPFLDASNYPDTGGYIAGRFCSSLLGPNCCLPCPQTNWVYPDNFNQIAKSASWLNVVGLVCCMFLLLSYAVLPVNKTHRHYLSICLAIAVVFMELGFIIPLGTKPNQCYNDITPNDMTTNMSCALSGAFLLAGGWSGVMWVFLRAVSLHLQICWQKILGTSFMWGALISGWGVPAIALTIAMIFSGVSYRFGDTCHINHKDSLADFWIPLLVFAAVTVIIQFATFGYCIKVYLASLADDSTTTGSSGLPSYTTSVRGTISPRQAYRRVRKVLELQWRGIVLVLLIIADVIFFAVIFVFLDDIETNLVRDPYKGEKWLLCLITSGGNKEQCIDLASSLVVNEATVMAVLLLLSLNGIWLLGLLGRTSMLSAWLEFFRKTFSKRNNEFVSADVRIFKDPSSYEMLGKETSVPEPTITPIPAPVSPPTKAKTGRETPDYFGREARYTRPTSSFSAPQRVSGMTWDSERTHARPMGPLNMNKI